MPLNKDLLQTICEDVRSRCFVINDAIAKNEVTSDTFYVEMQTYGVLTRYYDGLCQILAEYTFTAQSNIDNFINEFLDKYLEQQRRFKLPSTPDCDEVVIRKHLPKLFKHNASTGKADPQLLPPPKDIGFADLDYKKLAHISDRLAMVRASYNHSMPHDLRKYNLAFADHEKKPVMCSDITKLIWCELVTQHRDSLASIHSCHTEEHNFLRVTLIDKQEFFVDGWYGVVLEPYEMGLAENITNYPALCGKEIKGNPVPLHTYRSCYEFFSDACKEHPAAAKAVGAALVATATYATFGASS